jgi:hypothetical protein
MNNIINSKQALLILLQQTPRDDSLVQQSTKNLSNKLRVFRNKVTAFCHDEYLKDGMDTLEARRKKFYTATVEEIESFFSALPTDIQKEWLEDPVTL